MHFSSGQRGGAVHIGGGEVHGQHHEGFLRRSRHCFVNGGVCPPVWTTDKYVRLFLQHCLIAEVISCLLVTTLLFRHLKNMMHFRLSAAKHLAL